MSSSKLLHQLVVVVGERLQHGEARGLLAVERVAFEHLDDLGWRVLAVDEGALEREIDEAGTISFSQIGICRSTSGLREAGCRIVSTSRMLVGLVDLVEEQEARNLLVLELAQDELQLRHLLLVSSQTTTAASTAGSAARMSWTNSTEPGQSMKV